MLDPRSLRAVIGDATLLTEPADCVAYGFDNSGLSAQPTAVVLARSTSEIQAVVRWCAEHSTPVTVRGRGTNTVGATIPLTDGIVLSLEQMDRVLEYRPEDRMLRVEAGCLNHNVQERVRPDGLFWAPDPTSAAYSCVGGNLGCNAGGPHAVRYGTCRDNTLGLSAVLGDGSLIQVGSQTTKSVTGLDLTRLLIGSEGTLGIITEATLRLTPLPPARTTIRAEFASVDAAAAAVSALLSRADYPAVCEFMDTRAVGLVRDTVDLHRKCAALLLLEFHGPLEQGTQTSRAWRQACQDGLLDWRDANDPETVRRLWAARKALSPSLKRIAPNKTNEDVVVPVSRIPQLIKSLNALSARSGIPIVCFGHAGNGNLHVNLMYDRNNPEQAQAHDDCLRGVFEATIACGGSLSGEHGIGLSKRDFLDLELSPASLAAMRAVKNALDPAGILNPDKGLPLI